MDNPIQQVLDAEQAAQDQIEHARLTAEESIARAQRMARVITERSEARTHRAIVAFEQRQTRAVTDEIHSLRKQRRTELRHHTSRIDAGLDDLADEVVDQFWPAMPAEG